MSVLGIRMYVARFRVFLKNDNSKILGNRTEQQNASSALDWFATTFVALAGDMSDRIAAEMLKEPLPLR